MTSAQDHKQSIASNDFLIGTLVYHISVILSLVSSENSHKGAEIFLNNSFEAVNWNHAMESLGMSHGSSPNIVGGNNARDYVVSLIGQAYRCSPESQRLPLLQALKDIFSPSTSSTPTVPTKTQTNVEQQQDSDDNVPLHRYTSILHERAQREDKSFQRIAEECVTFNPPLFKVTIKYGVLTCSGQARNKKEAGHLAAKEIFKQLKETL